jgi:hypothetical protein
MVRELEAPYDNVARGDVVSVANRLMSATHRIGSPTSNSIVNVRMREQAERLAGLRETMNQLRALRRREPGWNTYDALAPDHTAIKHSESWVRQLYGEVVSAGAEWIHPHVTSSAEGEVVFEWWRGPRMLIIYVSPDETYYSKSLDDTPSSDLDQGDASGASTQRQLWSWLTS